MIRCAASCSAFGLKVVPAKAVIAALPDMFNAKQAQTRDAAKILAVRAVAASDTLQNIHAWPAACQLPYLQLANRQCNARQNLQLTGSLIE